MKLTGLLARPNQELPGTAGVARVDRRTGPLLQRVSAGDIAVLDEIDLDKRTADALVRAEVAGVVNAAPSISGRFPNLGPEILISAGIVVIDNVGADVLRTVRDGVKLRLHEGVVYLGEKEVGRGIEQTPESIADAMIQAKTGMSAQLEAFSANTIEFLRCERSLILDGVGVPAVSVPIAGRHVLVVAAGSDHAADLNALRRYIRDYRPALVGVEAGAEALRAAQLTPDLIVGDPRLLTEATLRCGAEVVIPADSDGFAAGAERIQDLGVDAIPFPASSSAEDLALLLAAQHGATLVITVGVRATLHEFLDRGRSGSNPSMFLTRLKLGATLIDGKAVAALYRDRVSMGAVLLLVLSAAVAVLAALLVSGLFGEYLEQLAELWRTVVAWGRGLYT